LIEISSGGRPKHFGLAIHSFCLFLIIIIIIFFLFFLFCDSSFHVLCVTSLWPARMLVHYVTNHFMEIRNLFVWCM
jgi:hypothetical protein